MVLGTPYRGVGARSVPRRVFMPRVLLGTLSSSGVGAATWLCPGPPEQKMGLKEGQRWWNEAGAPEGLRGEGGDCVRMGLCQGSLALSCDLAPAGL